MRHTIVNLRNEHGILSIPVGFKENVVFDDGTVHRLHEPLQHVGATRCGVIFTNKGCESCTKPMEPDGPVAELTEAQITCDACNQAVARGFV